MNTDLRDIYERQMKANAALRDAYTKHMEHAIQKVRDARVAPMTTISHHELTHSAATTTPPHPALVPVPCEVGGYRRRRLDEERALRAKLHLLFGVAP